MDHPYRLVGAAVLAIFVAGCSPFDRGAQVPTARPSTVTPPPTSTPLPTAVAQPTSALPQNGAAPGRPVGLDVWMPGNKQGVGTAFTYDQPPGDTNPSRVWFGITNGAITEGLYPDVSQANIKSLNVLVTDGKSFLADEIEDATYRTTEKPGRLSIGLELPTSGASTIALGFGKGREQARAAAETSLKRGFATVSLAYMRGWAAYLDKLDHPYPTLALYDESLAVLKTHEDKTNYGAFVASLAVPWGQHTTDDDPLKKRGYRYVWARDLYHIATALRLAGDQQA